MLRSKLYWALATLAFAGCGGGDDGGDGGCANRLLCDAPLVVAHRGGGLLRPEETLLAFENAIAVGAQVLECDVHSTSDGELVLMHDDTVDRTTDGTGKLHDFSLAELRELDAGYHFSPDGGATHPYRGAGVRVPTLREALESAPGRWWSIEVKQTTPNIVDDVIRVLDETGATDHVVVVSFADDVVHEVREKRPDILTGMAMAEMLELSMVSADTEADYRPPTRLVQPPAAMVKTEVMDLAKRKRLRIHAWTVNDEAEMTRLLELRVHGIMTDDPELLRSVIAARR